MLWLNVCFGLLCLDAMACGLMLYVGRFWLWCLMLGVGVCRVHLQPVGLGVLCFGFGCVYVNWLIDLVVWSCVYVVWCYMFVRLVVWLPMVLFMYIVMVVAWL